MTDDNTRRLTRRTALQGIAGAGGAAILGAGATLALSGGASATAESDMGNKTGSTDDGSVGHVSIYGDTVVDWEGFDTEATHFDIVSEVGVVEPVDGTEYTVVERQEINSTGVREIVEDWGGSGESSSGPGTSGELVQDVGLDSEGNHDPITDWAILQADGYDDPYGLPQTPAPADDLTVSEDGGSATYEVTLYSTYTWYGDNGETEIFTETFPQSFELTINNIEESASVGGGDGEDGVVIGDGSNETVAE